MEELRFESRTLWGSKPKLFSTKWIEKENKNILMEKKICRHLLPATKKGGILCITYVLYNLSKMYSTIRGNIKL